MPQQSSQSQSRRLRSTDSRDFRTLNVRERFDSLISDLRNEFKDRFGRRRDYEWNADYRQLCQRYVERFDMHFVLPPAEAHERRCRIENVIQIRLDDRREKAMQVMNNSEN